MFETRGNAFRKKRPTRINKHAKMQTLQDTIRNWAMETARQRQCACGSRSGLQGFDQDMREIAGEALDCFLQLPEEQFKKGSHAGMFAETVSFWKELGAADFPRRTRPEACRLFPENFRCDIQGLDVHQVLLYNGCICGPKGKNLLDPAQDAGLGRNACVCRLEDLADTEQNRTRLNAFFEEARQGLCTGKKESKVKTTADFARGGREAGIEQSKWLNRALCEDTLVVYLPKGFRLEKPLQIISLCHGEKPSFVLSRIWVLLEEGASLSLVECTDSNPKAEVLAHSLTEIRLEETASLEYIQLQNVGDGCKIFHDFNVQQERASNLSSYNLILNGGTTRNQLEVNLNQPEARADLLGLYLQDHEQKASTQVKVNHLAPKTCSRELFKGVVDDSASTFFKGHVFVSPAAEQTEAFQSNRNLLVSPKAQAHAKPYLEIYADDVQCNHGVTVGQLDETALFYMRSRGIAPALARRLLMRAYASEIIGSIRVESIKNWMEFLVKKRFSGQLQACEQCVLACPEKNLLP